jgi:hypothetical protein
MSVKASIATHTLFLIISSVMFLAVTIILLWPLISPISEEATKATCTTKYYDYCEKWILSKKDPDDWDVTNPIDCEDFDIYKPTFEECEELIN